MRNRLSDTSLVLFLTQGGSLWTWDSIGMFEREVALYQALHKHLRGITFVTYSRGQDLRYVNRLNGIRIFCNLARLPERWYTRVVSTIYPLCWPNMTVLKSNQIIGADVALHAAHRFNKKFIARGGYLYSDFMERQHGAASLEAQQARALEQKVFTGADQIVVTTSAMHHDVLQRYQVSPSKVTVIPNYVLTDRFCPASHLHRVGRRICFVGRLEEQKNLLALLYAIKGLDIELFIIGGGSLGDQLRSEAKTHNLPVQFLGNVPHEQLPEILCTADLFILPSLYEGHPKTLLEAMACGLPVIGTDVSGIREVIRHRETGYLCGTSPEEIRAAIQEMLGNYELRQQLGSNAREFIVEHFSLEHIVKLELAVLGNLIR